MMHTNQLWLGHTLYGMLSNTQATFKPHSLTNSPHSSIQIIILYLNVLNSDIFANSKIVVIFTNKLWGFWWEQIFIKLYSTFVHHMFTIINKTYVLLKTINTITFHYLLEHTYVLQVLELDTYIRCFVICTVRACHSPHNTWSERTFV